MPGTDVWPSAESEANQPKAVVGPFICPDWLRRRRLTNLGPGCQHGSSHGPYLHQASDTLPMEVRECFYWRTRGQCTKGDLCVFEHKSTAHGLVQEKPMGSKGGKKKKGHPYRPVNLAS